MRAIAAGLLAMMAVGFVLTSLAARRWPEAADVLGYGRAFAEAGMVGACADWFAVAALFRRPLGLPIPHTAIVPRNQARIGQALGGFIADNFLSARVLDSRLRAFELASWGGAWLQRPTVARTLARRAAALTPELLDVLPPGALAALLSSAGLAGARAAPAAPLASKLLAAAWNEGRAQALIEALAGRLSAYLSENREIIQQKVAAQSYKWLPAFVDRMIADKITAGVIQLLADVQDPAHAWRMQMSEAVERLIVRLDQDPELCRRGEALKARLLDDPRLRGHLAAVCAELETRLRADLRDRADEVADRLEQAIGAAGRWLQDEPGVQAELNRWARIVALRGLAPRRHAIGRFVAGVVEGWDSRAVVDKLELMVGRDLQYIRVNGTLVGGLVGLLIHGVSRALGL